MQILSVYDDAFRAYGRVVEGMEAMVAELLPVLAETPLPDGAGLLPGPCPLPL